MFQHSLRPGQESGTSHLKTTMIMVASLVLTVLLALAGYAAKITEIASAAAGTARLNATSGTMATDRTVARIGYDEGDRQMESVARIAGPFCGTYRAWFPALPGCAVYGGSRHEAKTRIWQAVRGYLEHLDVALPRELARRLRGCPVEQ